MRILLTAGDKQDVKNYKDYLKILSDNITVINPSNFKEINPTDYHLLVLSGGKDVNPRRYGEEIKYDSVEIEEERDEMEFELIDRFLHDSKPIFGICRGFQVLTVFFGGSLYQDLKKEGFKPIHKGKDNGDTEHDVIFSGIFEREFGYKGSVNSNHHQGLKGFPERLGNGEILAVSEDHLVEAFISRKYKVFAVQWHPERHKSEISEGLLKILKREFL